ncbi:MAG: hypothetical protein V2A65_01300 [Candidatus Omnitrophota bacterium]
MDAQINVEGKEKPEEFSARVNQLKGDEVRRKGKILRVNGYPSGGNYVPGIRVAGKWLRSCRR